MSIDSGAQLNGTFERFRDRELKKVIKSMTQEEVDSLREKVMAKVVLGKKAVKNIQVLNLLQTKITLKGKVHE